MKNAIATSKPKVAEIKLMKAKLFLASPFELYMLKEKERVIITAVARGSRFPAIAADVGCARQEVYRALKQALKKVSEIEGRPIHQSDLTAFVLDRLEEIINE